MTTISGLFKKYKNIVLGIILIVALFFAYSLLFSNGEDRNKQLSSEVKSSATAEVGQELLALLLRLKAIELDDSIFSDPGFNRLQDFGQTIRPQPVGRRNPFAPLGEEQTEQVPEN